MSWDEFVTLLSGLNGDTPLGNIVSIRAENDKERLKSFTPEQRRIRNEWRNKNKTTKADGAAYNDAITGFAAMFKSMAKGGG